MTADNSIISLNNSGAMITDQDAARLALAGQAANAHAALGVFADYQSRKAANSLHRHAGDLARFAEYLTEAGVYHYAGDPDDRHDFHRAKANRLQSDPASWQGMTWGVVEGFRTWLVMQGFAIGTVNNSLSTVKVYAKLAAKAGAIAGDEYNLIKLVAGYNQREAAHVDERRDVTRQGHKKAAAVVISPAQAKMLKHQPDTPQGRRDALIMTLLLDHGLRVGELAGLKVSDFDLAAGMLRIFRPKVGKVQTHKLTADALRAVQNWINSGDAPIMADSPILRASRKSKHSNHLDKPGMSERAITERVKELGKAAGLTGLSAHDCRHYWATFWAKKVDPFQLKEAGGWTSIATVDRYVEAGKIANEGMA